MINKNFKKYACETWQSNAYIKPLSEVSKPDSNNSPLINRSEEVYSFDDISNMLYEGGRSKPHSVDGLFFCQNITYFVEFKTGFKKKITKKNYSVEMVNCPTHNHSCEDYAKLFFKNQNKETNELISSIKFKAIESYITLEKQILPLCDDSDYNKIVLIVVIDEDEIDDYENTLLELSEQHIPSNSDKNNCFRSLLTSLRIYNIKKDKQSPPNDYFYDEIKVFSAKGFSKFFDGLLSKKINPSSLELLNV